MNSSKKNSLNKQKNNLYVLGWILLYLAIFSFSFFNASSKLDPDFGWHLRIGADIAQSNDVPRIEKYTYPTLGQEWVDHEWLSNLLLYKAYTFSPYGYLFLAVLFSLFFVITLHLVISATRKYVVADLEDKYFLFLSSIISILAVIVISSFFGVRLQVISWFLMIFMGWLLTKVYFEKKFSLLSYVPFIFILWTNLHGSFIFGIGLLSLFILLLFLHDKFSKKDKLLSIIILLACILVTLISPYCIDLWKLIGEEYSTNRYYLTNIDEWLPVYTAPFVMWQFSLLIALYLVLIIFGFLSKSIPLRVSALIYFGFTFFLLILSVLSRRFSPLFIIFSIPLFLFLLDRLFFTDYLIEKERIFKFIIVPLLVLVVFIKIFHILSEPHKPLIDPFEKNSTLSPTNAVNYLKQDPVLSNKKLLNYYGWGGFLLWTYPEKKIFIDGRMPQRPLDHEITYLEEYDRFFDQEHFVNKINQYEIEVALFPTKKDFVFPNTFEKHLYKIVFSLDEKDFQQEHHLLDYLDQNWIKLFEDEIAVIYVRPENN